MAFASLDLLATVVADLAADLGPFDRLGVDAGGTGGLLTTGLGADASSQRVEDGLPGAIAVPALEVIVGGSLGDEVVRQEVPLATGAALVEQGVDDLAQVDRPRSTTGFGGQQNGFDQGPLGVAQVGGIGFPHGCCPATGGFVATPSPGDMLRGSRLSE